MELLGDVLAGDREWPAGEDVALLPEPVKPVAGRGREGRLARCGERRDRRGRALVPVRGEVQVTRSAGREQVGHLDSERDEPGPLCLDLVDRHAALEHCIDARSRASRGSRVDVVTDAQGVSLGGNLLDRRQPRETRHLPACVEGGRDPLHVARSQAGPRPRHDYFVLGVDEEHVALAGPGRALAAEHEQAGRHRGAGEQRAPDGNHRRDPAVVDHPSADRPLGSTSEQHAIRDDHDTHAVGGERRQDVLGEHQVGRSAPSVPCLLRKAHALRLVSHCERGMGQHSVEAPHVSVRGQVARIGDCVAGQHACVGDPVQY